MAVAAVEERLKELELALEELEMGAEAMEAQTQQEAMEPQIGAVAVVEDQRKHKQFKKMAAQAVRAFS